MKTIRAILIDSVTHEVKEVQIPSRGLQEVYSLLRCGIVECAYPHSEKDMHSMYLDEEGLYNQSHDFIEVKGYGQQLFAGSGLITGFDANRGETTDCTYTVDEVKQRVKFLTRLQAMVRARQMEM
jgi:hypothetical protein